MVLQGLRDGFDIDFGTSFKTLIIKTILNGLNKNTFASIFLSHLFMHFSGYLFLASLIRQLLQHLLQN
jgi:hypothetical protein